MRRSVRGPKERMMGIITTTGSLHRSYSALALSADLPKMAFCEFAPQQWKNGDPNIHRLKLIGILKMPSQFFHLLSVNPKSSSVAILSFYLLTFTGRNTNNNF